MNVPLEQMAIFAGPSKSGHLDPGGARIFPPARSGDVRNAAENGFTHIVLADTLFLDAPPNHGEIMEIMSLGTTVFGCSSAGALRAIELRNSGMIGCGIVHDLYRAGKLRDDSELACVIDDEYRAVTPALIEIRYYLGHALALGAPSQSVARAFEKLNSIYYMRRDFDTVHSVMADHFGAGSQQVYSAIEDPAFRIKSIDLENCLADIAEAMQARVVPFHRSAINTEWLERGLSLGP